MKYRRTRAERHTQKEQRTRRRQAGYTEEERRYYANRHICPDRPDDYDVEDWERDEEEDEFERALSECGMTQGGGCMLAGTEFCDWDCPFSRDEFEELEIEE